MHIVINISDDIFKRLVAGKVQYGGITARNIFNSVKEGTPLPKGHGRLIDADTISLDDIGFFSISDHQKMVHKLTTCCQTIIEADKE